MSRILMVLDHSYPPDVRVENEAESLADVGHEVTILAIGPDDRPVEDRSGRVRIIRDRMPAALRNKLRGLAGAVPLLSLYVSARMAAIHRNWPFDAVQRYPPPTVIPEPFSVGVCSDLSTLPAPSITNTSSVSWSIT